MLWNSNNEWGELTILALVVYLKGIHLFSIYDDTKSNFSNKTWCILLQYLHLLIILYVFMIEYGINPSALC